MSVLNKSACRRLLAAYGAPVPDPHEVIGTLKNLTPELLQEPRVVKPVRGNSSLGVCVLVPDGPGRWIELLSGKRRTFDELIDRLKRVMTRRQLSDEWIVEELQLPVDGKMRVIEDVKVYAFRGATPLVLVTAPNPKRYRWFTPDWQPVTVGKYEESIDDSLEPPTQPDSLLELAASISRRLPIPFMRIDIYDTMRGPVVGELTPLPGNFYGFDDAWDEHLGELYENAESQLMTEGMNWRGLHGHDQAWNAVAPHAERIRLGRATDL